MKRLFDVPNLALEIAAQRAIEDYDRIKASATLLKAKNETKTEDGSGSARQECEHTPCEAVENH